MSGNKKKPRIPGFFLGLYPGIPVILYAGESLLLRKCRRCAEKGRPADPQSEVEQQPEVELPAVEELHDARRTEYVDGHDHHHDERGPVDDPVDGVQ